MDRRAFLGFMAAATVTLASPPAASASDTVTFYDAGSWQEMAHHLWQNLCAFNASNGRSLDGDEAWVQAVCHRFCRSLVGPEEGSVEWLIFPESDRSTVRSVRFGVTSSPYATFDGARRPVATRRIRAAGIDRSREALADFSTCWVHGMNPETELLEATAQECAYDVMREVQSDAAAGRRPNAYVLYLPPFVHPLDPKPMHDFTVCRGWMLRYAKFAEGTSS